MSPCVLTRECSCLLYISITIMLLSLSLLCYYLKKKWKKGVIPYVLPSTSSHFTPLLHTFLIFKIDKRQHQQKKDLLLIKVNRKKRIKKKKKGKCHLACSLENVPAYYISLSLLCYYLYHYYVIISKRSGSKGYSPIYYLPLRLKSHHFVSQF